MAVDDGKGSASQGASGVSGADPSSPSQSQAAPAPLVQADALTITSDPASPKPAAMAETEEDKVRDFSALTGIVDGHRCAQILAASGWDLDLAVASVPADPSSTGAAPTSPQLVAPVMPDAYQPGGIARKLITMPFCLIGGGMDLALCTVRLSFWAIGRALSLIGWPSGGDREQRLIDVVSEDTVFAGDRARFLPHDILFEVARRLRSNRRDVQAMRAVCPQWRSAVPNTNGPWLVLSRRQLELPPGTQKIAVLQMVAHAGAAAADVTMEVVPCLSLPPLSATCWGAAHGLVALRSGTNDLYLFCLICGSRRNIPPLSGEMTPYGIFFNEHPLEPLATLIIDDADLLNGDPRLHQELIDLPNAQRHRWAMYPSTEAHVMRSVCFDDCVHFIGATSENMVVIDELGGPPGQDMVVVHAPLVADVQMEAWLNYGHHVFKCSDNIYLCLLFRDYEDVNVVSVQVFLLQSSAGYHLVPTNDIGSYAVYLGANKPVVLPAEDGSIIQRKNTIYVTDDDGVVTNGRVISVDLSSHEVSFIPFPNGASINDYGHASWVTAPPLDPLWHTWHCNSQ